MLFFETLLIQNTVFVVVVHSNPNWCVGHWATLSYNHSSTLFSSPTQFKYQIRLHIVHDVGKLMRYVFWQVPLSNHMQQENTAASKNITNFISSTNNIMLNGRSVQVFG